ncbi:MAG: hypothetical protein CMN85_02475 [Spongiibacteraceae bacterium]|nr:hypothetical protein [Spongiibacteraceae bacterium]
MKNVKWCGVVLCVGWLLAAPVSAGLFDTLKSTLSAGGSSESKEERALDLYRSGKKKYEKGNYADARNDLWNAIKLYSSDGNIKISKDQQVEWVETPRGLERRVVSDSTSYDYQPNKYLRLVDLELDKIAADKERRWKQDQQNELAAEERRKKFSNPPVLHISYDFIDNNRDGKLSAKESGKVVVTLENTGGYAGAGVELEVKSSDASLSLGCCDQSRKVSVGEIAPGQAVVETFEIIASEKIGSGREHLSFVATEQDGFGTGDESRLAITTQEYLPAIFELAEQKVSHVRGNIYQVDYIIINRGKGPSLKTVAQVRPDNNNIYVLDNTRVEIGRLAPNASQAGSFTFSKNNRVKEGDALPLSVRAFDESDDATQKEFALALSLPQGGASPARYASGTNQSNVPLAAPAAAIAVENVDVDIPVGSDRKPYGRAVIIGNSRYSNLDDVAFATNDSRSVRAYAEKTLGYKRVLYKEDQGSYDLKEIFGTKDRQFKDGTLYKMVSRDSERQPNPPVFIYYSGHGAPGLSDGKAYIVPVDAQMNRLDQQGYPLEDLYAAIKSLPTNDVTLVLDSCFSGNSDTIAGGQAKALYKGVSPAAFRTNSLKPENIPGLTMFSSAAASEVSYWHSESRHGLFTYNFLRALRGAADRVGGNKDGQLSAKEIQNYVEYEVAEYIDVTGKGSRQTPGLTGQSEKVIAKLQ